MVLALGIIIFIIGCCLSSFEDSSYNACFFAIVFPKNLYQNSNKFADRIPGNLQLQIC